MSRVSVRHGRRGGGEAPGGPVPNPHPPTGQVHGSRPRCAPSGVGVPEA
jgi:hypothetical protein